MTTNLETLIKALEAGDYDSILAGTKYEGAVDIRNRIRNFTYTSPEEQKRQLKCTFDAAKSAARCIVLEAAVRELREALVWSFLENNQDNPLDPDACLTIHFRLAATKKLVGGGE